MCPTRALPRMFAVAVALSQALSAKPAMARSSADGVAARSERAQGTVALNLGRHDEAVEHFARAYGLTQDPEILFSLAQAYRLGGKPEKALATYSAFLRAAGARAKYRPQIERAAAEIEIITSFMLSHGGENRGPDKPATPAAEPAPGGEAVAKAAPAPAVEPVAEPVKPEPAPAPLAVLTPKPEPAPVPALTFPSEPEPTPPARPIHKRWWFWTGLTLVAAAGGAAAWWYAQPDQQTPASTYGAVRVLP